MKTLLLLLCLFFLELPAQQGFTLGSRAKTTIPFRQINNLSFVEVTVNGVPLTLLLDTGVSETILFSLENKNLNFSKAEKVRFTGLGKDNFVEGLKSTNNRLEAGKHFTDGNHTLFIILDAQFNFSSHVGIPVNGILGRQFFANHPVKIDFTKHSITIYREGKSLTKTARRYTSLPMNIENGKPYIETAVELGQKNFNAKMLVDLGNSDAVWLFKNKYADFEIPVNSFEDFLGRGFNGDIFGKRSRIKSIKLANFTLNAPVTSFPDSASTAHMAFAENRVGSVGSAVLKKFNLILDYPNRKLLLQKNSNFSEPFKFNMSGLDIRHEGMQWERDLIRLETKPYTDVKDTNTESIQVPLSEYRYKFVLKPVYSIVNVRKDSPGALAGLQSGDLLLEIDRKRTSEMQLQQINSIFMSEENRTVKLKVQRNGKILDKSLVLKDPLPSE